MQFLTIVTRVQQYDASIFKNAGFKFIDLYFPDGTCPPEAILQGFLELAEQERGAIVVHCKAGLGRTGTLIGCYLMKHFGFTAEEVRVMFLTDIGISIPPNVEESIRRL
jgi:protein-tyrosine phosphatase